MENLRPLADAMPPNIRSVLMDLTNHGGSPHDDDATITSMVEDVRYTLEKIHNVPKAGEILLLGHGLGARVAMQLALSDPKFVRLLCIVDTPPVPPGREEREFSDKVLPAMNSLHLPKLRNRKDAFNNIKIENEQWKSLVLANLDISEADSQTGFTSASDSEADHKWIFGWRCNLAGLTENVDILQNHQFEGIYSQPVLFISGEKSNVSKSDYLDHFNQMFPNNDHLRVAGAGHWVHNDNPDYFQELVKEFFTEGNHETWLGPLSTLLNRDDIQ